MPHTTDIRNIAIIAHVDHGKTTLIDQMLRQSGALADHQTIDSCALDSNALERERGITILAKATGITWQSTQINVIDTPGHADFGGEVERILSMVDGVLLLVDAAEGPMPQTKFVTGKALGLNLKPIVVINKIDKSAANPDDALNAVFDLFVDLDANEAQLDFPVLYASGRDGWAVSDLNAPRSDLVALFEAIVQRVAPPQQMQHRDKQFQMLATILGRDAFIGRTLTGRIETGIIRVGDNVQALSAKTNTDTDTDVKPIETFRITKIIAANGLSEQALDTAAAGDIVTLAGMARATVADTLCAPGVLRPLAAAPIDPPTISITLSINDSPLAGQSGDKLQSRVIRERLRREAEANVALSVQDTEGGFQVFGRGELQMGVLIETMRREGFELSVSRPQVVLQHTDTGVLEPFEDVTIDVDEAYTGAVLEKLTGEKRGQITAMKPARGGKTRITAKVPARGLIGYNNVFLTDTRGTGILAHVFSGWHSYAGAIPGRTRGVLIAMDRGQSVAYALYNLEGRGRLFIAPQTQVYQGMIIGEHSRDNDLDVNPLKGKKLTNIRAAGKDDAVVLTPPIDMGLEAAIAYINDDELVEVTPDAVRLRKRYLDPHVRKRMAQKGA